jgi:endoglucanase
VKDATPASDGDLLTAWALLRARGALADYYHAQGQRIASAVLSGETARRGRATMLTAGPWANGSPVTLDPSYWAPPAFADLAGETGMAAFSQLTKSSLDTTRALTAGGRLLPPDWARVDGTKARPTPAPGGQPPAVQYGLDAQRLVVWMAASCDSAARKLAAHWWPTLSPPGRSGAMALDQHGNVLNGATSPLPFVATAAAAGAAGHYGERDRLLEQAAAADHAHPTYYGAAWVALGRALSTTRLLGGCAQGGSS